MISLTLFRVKSHFEVASPQSEASRKNSSVPCELASKPSCYLLKTGRSKSHLSPIQYLNLPNSPYSVKDLPQEVKDGLEIIHVRYAPLSRVSLSQIESRIET